MNLDPNAPLRSELRCFVRHRWQAGAVFTLGTLIAIAIMGWSDTHGKILLIGSLILLYNLPFWLLFRDPPAWLDKPGGQKLIAWIQIVLDLVCLSALVSLTGGVFSPVLGLFVLHMIFASLLLVPPVFTPYIAWILAVAILAVALQITAQLPETSTERWIASGWAGTLAMTVYFTSHVAQNMRNTHDRTRDILNTVHDGILTVNKNGTIILVNSAIVRMFGYTSSQLCGHKLEKMFDSREIDAYLHANAPDTNSTARTVDGCFETVATRKNGTTFPVEITAERMHMGNLDTFTIVIRDRTEKNRAHAELNKLHHELDRQQESLLQHEKMIAVGRMAAGVAHEISNPLANMDGLIQLVERNPDRMKAETPQLLREQVTRISRIVRQLKDFAHPADSGQRVVSLDELIQAAVDMIRFDKRHHIIEIERDSTQPSPEVCVYAQSIEQVLVNVLINALDAVADEEGPQVKVRASALEPSIARITVTDNGTGIAAEHLDRIFEPFYTTKPLGEGTGLGLSISYNLVRRDGGRIDIESAEGAGTSVSICFPVVACQEAVQD
jgi:PAS domain S-box-containing protein